ncbi:MAG: M3 family metallopeptidase [Nostocoides sp.]
MTNPLLSPSSLPLGLPPYAAIRDEHYVEALEAGMAEHRVEVDAITANPEPATFENTVVALERSGRLLDRVTRVFFGVSAAHGTPAVQQIETDFSPKLSAHADAIRLDPVLFERIKSVHDDRRAMAALDPESRRLVERYVVELTAAGAGLDARTTARLRDLNGQLATLTTQFRNDVLAETADGALTVADGTGLDGLTPGEISAAAAAAADRGVDGYVLTLRNTSGHPYLASLTDRAVRQRLQQAQVTRGSHGGLHDTRAAVVDITALRAERAAILGYPSHAAATLADSTAGSPEAVSDLLGRLAPAAARNARAEQAELEQTAGEPVAAYDWAFHSARVRREKYDVDVAALRPWFEAERVLRDGVFYAAGRLFGLTFHDRPDLVGWHPDVRTFEVREEDGTVIGLFLLDLYSRDTKKGGAWMNSLVLQNTLLGVSHAVVTNNLNVSRPAEGEPTLLTLEEVNTFFHEFGHALHGLLARVTYPHFAGTQVFRDFVEYPSQVNEMWILWPEVLANYAVHHQTGEPLPQDIVDRLIQSRSYGEGFATAEYLGAALLDQAWHALAPGERVADADAFEAQALLAVGLDNPAVPPRYRTSYFSHAFSYGYDAQYYAYIWSEVLDADTVAWFEGNGGLTRANGDRYREFIIGIGGSKDPLESYRAFRGADPDIGHLLARRGLD